MLPLVTEENYYKCVTSSPFTHTKKKKGLTFIYYFIELITITFITTLVYKVFIVKFVVILAVFMK